MTADLAIIYCEAEKENIGLIQQVRLEAPLTVAEGDKPTLTLDYTIELPDIGSSS